MAINFQQTDSTTGACTVNAEGTQRRAADGEAAGSTPISISVAGSAADQLKHNITLIVDAGVTWAAGTWTVRLNVTTANMNLTWDRVDLARRNSACFEQETIGSSTGLGISLGTTGVKSTTVTGSAATPGAGDVVDIYFYYDNSSMNAAAFGFTPNQLIDSPFVGVTIEQGTTLFAAAGTMATVATLNMDRTATFAAAGSMASTALTKIPASTVFSAAGTMASAATVAMQRSTAFSAAAALITTATLKIPAVTAYTGAATLSTAAQFVGATAFSGAGDLSTSATVAIQRTTAFDAAGSLASAARLAATTAYSASGDLVTVGEIAVISRDTAFTASGALTTSARFVATTVVTASGTLVSAARFVATTAYSGSGTLATVGSVSEQATTAFSVTGTLSTSAVLKIAAGTAFAATGSLASAAQFTATTVFSGAGALTTVAAVSTQRTTLFAASGSTASDAVFSGATAFAASGSLASAAAFVGTTAFAASGDLSTDGGVRLFLRPASTDSAGGWVTELGGTNLHASIDEAIIDDDDYIRSSNTPSSDKAIVQLNAGSVDTTKDVVVTYRYRKEGAATIDLTVGLESPVGTVRASTTHNGITASFVDGSFTLSAAEAASVTWTDAHLALTANQV